MTRKDGIMGVIPYDLSSVIPKEEQVLEERNPVFYEVENITGDMISEIPEEERDIMPESNTSEFAEAKDQGCFLPVQGMKGFETDTGYKIFAKIHQDRKGNRYIEFCQQYSNDEFSEKMRIAQADLLISARYRFVSKEIPERKLRERVGKFVMEVTWDYYNKSVYPQECMNVEELLSLLIQNYGKLPLHNEKPRFDIPEVLYDTTIRNIRELGLMLFDNYKAYYALDKDRMTIVAEKMGLRRDELVKKLYEFRFLYTTGSAQGYQARVHVKGDGEFVENGHKEWYYCILKLDFLAKQKKLKKLEG